MTQNKREYWQILNEEYNVFPNGELMDEEVEKYFLKDQTQSTELISRYGRRH